jgi:hypothetical protein
MIYIGTTGNNGSAIYFDIHSAERQGRGMRFSGTVGDGCYEGEVLVETGRSESVTFADAWLGGSGFWEFIDRCGITMLEESLLESVRDMSFFCSRRSQPHANSGASGPSLVLESASLWTSRAS